MNCPVCKEVKLVISDRQGIEIDYCPECRGVWLDRGELDKIIDKSLPAARPEPEQRETYREERYDSHKHYDDDYKKYDNDYYHKKKKRGFLGEIFDFD